ncbi:unnamed protein product, partial [Didymodactylos carnosus]
SLNIKFEQLTTCTSIEDLVLTAPKLSINQNWSFLNSLGQLLSHIPNLKSLRCTLIVDDHFGSLVPVVKTNTNTFVCRMSDPTMYHFDLLSICFPYLKGLDLNYMLTEIDNVCSDGGKWEQLIVKRIP